MAESDLITHKDDDRPVGRLVLSRYAGEAVVLNHGTPEQITVKVVRAGRNRVRLGVETPDGVVVLRGELVKDKGDEN